MSGVILGTAGHIDHGKTALVRALTGVDTDRLAQEKARGITIELGFAELTREGHPRLGVVDVPGHHGFVRMMVAGATGMDLVLLVVAADEGVMPQTREHLAIVELLDVPRMVVALTKCDLVEPEWLELVDAEVGELLAGTRYASAPRVPTSVETGVGMEALLAALLAEADEAGSLRADDLARLPFDRVFTIQGTGTVVTGTLWSGRLERGARVRILPGGSEARIRSLQVHGRDVERAEAGDRTAAALTGLDRGAIERGSTLVVDDGWSDSLMLTCRVRVLPDTGWELADRQRVRVHLATAEVMARCAILEGERLGPGDVGWVQLRLEAPVVARARDRVVLRSYSPVTTLGGGEVAEPVPPKRKLLDGGVKRALEDVLDGDDAAAVGAALQLGGRKGVSVAALPVLTGRTAAAVRRAVEDGGDADGPSAGRVAFSAGVVADAADEILAALRAELDRDPLRSAVPLDLLRSAVPAWSHDGLADRALRELEERGLVELSAGGAIVPGHEPTLTAEQSVACDRLLELIGPEELAPPLVGELPTELSERPDFWSLLKYLEEEERLRAVADGLYLHAGAVERAERSVVERLGGRRGLSPADFREALPVTRKHLIPLLNYLDGRGVTVREGDLRAVPER